MTQRDAITAHDRRFLRRMRVAWDEVPPPPADIEALQMHVRYLQAHMLDLVDERDAVCVRLAEVGKAFERQRRVKLRAQWWAMFFCLAAVLMAAVIGWLILFPGVAGR